MRDYDVPAGVINNAAAQGRALCRGRKNFFATLRRVLDAYVQVRNNGTADPFRIRERKTIPLTASVPKKA